MARCRQCGQDHDVEDLIRHERGRLVRVHCPDCKMLMGAYDSHTGSGTMRS